MEITNMREQHPAEDAPLPDERQDWFVRWIPIVVPLFALFLAVAAFFIEAMVF